MKRISPKLYEFRSCPQAKKKRIKNIDIGLVYLSQTTKINIIT